jgi:hypothetical protein
MKDRKQVREMEQVVRCVMKSVKKYDHIGKAEFEAILHKVVQQVHLKSKIDMARIAEATSTVIDDMPREYGRLSSEQRSLEAMIGYLYAKHLQVLGVLTRTVVAKSSPTG